MKKKEPKYLWEVLVPVMENGKEIPIAYHHKWDTKVEMVTGGLTIHKTTKGVWVSPAGKRYKDAMIPVRVFCTKKQFDYVLDLTLGHYKYEEEIFGYRVSDKVISRRRK